METKVAIMKAPELESVEQSKADKIKDTFIPMVTMLDEFEEVYNQIILDSKSGITDEIESRAKRLRLEISKVRTGTEKLRISEKAEYVRAGKAIDGVSNILKWAVTDKENILKGIENFSINQKIEALKKLQADRIEQLSPYVEDAHERDLTKFEEDEFEALLSAKKKEQKDKLAAERKAERERVKTEKINKLRWERAELIKPYYDFFNDDGSIKLGEITINEFNVILSDLKDAKLKHEKEQEQIRLDNKKLREAAETERLEREAERVERERLAKIESDKQAKIIADEKAKSDKLAAELKVKQAEAIENERLEKEKIQTDLNKGDAAKVKDLIADIELLKTKYSFKSVKNKKMYSDIGILLDKVKTHIK